VSDHEHEVVDASVAPSVVELAISAIMTESHVARGDELPALAQRHIAAFGGTQVRLYLADLQQSVLVPFLGSVGPDAPESANQLSIDTTLAGRAFQHLQIEIQENRPNDTIAWVPLLDGAERLGVLAITLANSTTALSGAGVAAQRLTMFAALLAELIMAKTLYGDEIVRLRRTSQMGLAAEIQWSLLPPLTFASQQVAVAAALEPAYQVAGDTVDYAVDGHIARVAIFDGMGHGLASAQLAAMAAAAYRHARRAGHSLQDTVTHIDQALLETFTGASFATAVLAELDTDIGMFSWVNAGHPEPLLLRNGRVIKTLHAKPRPPLGVVLPQAAAALRAAQPGVEHLEPGDCVLLYSDGVTEARSPAGDFFGEQRLVDLVVRNLAAQLPAPETMRRVVRALLEHQQGRLDDDASLLLIQWLNNKPAALP
jgi:hypothetical protein